MIYLRTKDYGILWRERAEARSKPTTMSSAWPDAMRVFTPSYGIMRILTLTNLYPNPLQPHRAPFSRQEVRALANRHQISVIAPIAWTDELMLRYRGKGRLPAQRRTTLGSVVAEHPRYFYPPRVFRKTYGWCFRESVRPAFERALAKDQPELVYAQWAYPDGWAAVQLGQSAGLPVVIKVHGSDVRLLDHHSGRRQGTIEALRQADAVVAVSQELARRVIDLGVDAQRVYQIYNGVDSSLFQPGEIAKARQRLGLSSQRPILLFVGNLISVKGVDLLIESLAKLKELGDPFDCHLIGQGPLETWLKRQVRQLGLQDHVHFLGPKPLDQLPDWYRAADLLVLPSRSEGVPGVLLEASACGLPFVASRVGGVPEIAHLGEGRLVPPEDTEALALAIADSLKAPKARRSLATITRTFEDVATDMTKLFENLVRGRVCPAQRMNIKKLFDLLSSHLSAAEVAR